MICTPQGPLSCGPLAPSVRPHCSGSGAGVRRRGGVVGGGAQRWRSSPLHSPLPLQGPSRQPHTATSAAAAGHKGGSQPAAAATAAELLEGRCPLVGFERLALALPAPLRPLLALHSYVLLDVDRGSGGGGGEPERWLFDFLPEDPTAPATAARLLAGLPVRGAARARRLAGRSDRFLPAGAAVVRQHARLARCDALAVAAAFTAAWPGELSLARRNCRHHTAALVAALLEAEAAAQNDSGGSGEGSGGGSGSGQ